MLPGELIMFEQNDYTHLLSGSYQFLSSIFESWRNPFASWLKNDLIFASVPDELGVLVGESL
jgi:hypothetical protein